MNNYLRNFRQHAADNSSAMERKPISKSCINLKNDRSRKNRMLSLFGFLIIAIMTGAFASCEKNDADSNNLGIGEPTATTDPGVVINGVRWATRNVDEFGTFVEKEEDYGKFYQWNRKKAWPTGIITGWDNSNPTGDTWEKANDPTPAGWRLPTLKELEKLEFDETNLIIEYRVQNNINGVLITDKGTGASMFLPYAGERESGGGSHLGKGLRGVYWSSHTETYERATYLVAEKFHKELCPDCGNTPFPFLINGYRHGGYSIRPVKE